MAGHVSVPLYPTLDAETHPRRSSITASARLVFVGKLDGFDDDGARASPTSCRASRCRSAPSASMRRSWDELVAQDRAARRHSRRARPRATSPRSSTPRASTGAPKGVMHSFATMCAAGKCSRHALGMSPDDRMLSYLPLAHVARARAGRDHATFTVGFHVFFAESLDTFVDRRAARAADGVRLGPAAVAQVPAVACSPRCPPHKLARLLEDPDRQRHVKKQGPRRPRARHVRFAVTGSAPDPARADQLVPRARARAARGLRHDRELRVSHAVATRRGRASATSATPLPGVECRLSAEGEILVQEPRRP